MNQKKSNKNSSLILVIILVLIIGFAAWIFFQGGIPLECESMSTNYCEKDDDCICNTNPCFEGNKNYYEKCVLSKKGITEACLDACGFGPYELDFRMICEDNQCTFGVFNRTTGERIR